MSPIRNRFAAHPMTRKAKSRVIKHSRTHAHDPPRPPHILKTQSCVLEILPSSRAIRTADVARCVTIMIATGVSLSVSNIIDGGPLSLAELHAVMVIGKGSFA
jgi:hypothetical protein